jgi:mono/diheme cytochrome c family protein
MRSLMKVVVLVFCVISMPGADSLRAAEGSRVTRDLQVLYTFEAGKGDLIRDRSGVGQPLNLKIKGKSGVQWKNGVLQVQGSARIQSVEPAHKITRSLKKANACSLEAWLKPANDRQKGPARILTLSNDPNRRNFTLGQDGRRYDVRLRTTSTSANGTPSVAAPDRSVRPQLTHVVYTRDAAGRAQIYVNGKLGTSQRIKGNFSNWDSSFRLCLANEGTGDRPWQGELHLVAVYSRALTKEEVDQNYRVGSQGKPSKEQLRELAQAKQRKLFETKVAPLLAQNCLECHDAASRKGGLDLSHKATALAGGESGKVILPGSAEKSLLWDQIVSGDMPPGNTTLKPAEKALLKEWLNGGAVWSVSMIDPAIYNGNSSAQEIWVQRLTIPEYIETVKSTVGVDISKEAYELLPPDLRADGFSNTAYNLNVDLKHVQAYARLAELIVQRMDVMKFARRFSKSKSLNTDATMRKFIGAMGQWLFRGPLDEREITNFSGIATTVASAGGSYEEGVSLIVEAMLQSPRFIYRIEAQRGDGTALSAGSYELASRLSYIIWGGPPDEDLLKAAQAGKLSDREVCRKQVERMLKDPRAVAQSMRFVSDWLNLDRLANMRPNEARFPEWDPQLGLDMREETLAFFQEIAWKENRPLSDLFNAQVTYATPRLARHYGLKPQGKGLQRYDLSGVPARGGLLTQGSILTIGGDDASMVTRGLFVLKDVLRGVIGAPPPGVDTTPVPSRPGVSQRMIAEQRMANEACAGCHTRFEPLAFGLEQFDGIGAFHDIDEYKNRLRSDGEILVPGAAKPVKYSTPAELMDLLAESERVRETITWKLTQFSLGRPLGPADASTVQKIHAASRKGGGTYSSLITAIVMSDLVQKVRTEGKQ